MRHAECHPDRKHYAHGVCKSCYGTKYAKVAPAWAKAQKKYRGSDKWKANQARSNLFQAHGIRMAQYEQMLAAQNGCCAICLSPPTKQRLAVDHCHTSGKRRGLLCDVCNRGLGFFKDSPQLLAAAIAYLGRVNA